VLVLNEILHVPTARGVITNCKAAADPLKKTPELPPEDSWAEQTDVEEVTLAVI
jgi:hypothetical protein